LGKAKSIRWLKNQALAQEDATLANIGLVVARSKLHAKTTIFIIDESNNARVL